MLKKFTIKTKLFLLVAIPSIAYLLLAINTLNTSYNKQSNTLETLKYINTYNNISNIIFSLQTQRRLSLSLILNKTTKKQKLLEKQIKLTHKFVDKFPNNMYILAELKLLEENNKFTSLYNKVQNKYTALIEYLLNKQAKDIFYSHDKKIIEALYNNNKLLNIIELSDENINIYNKIISEDKVSQINLHKFHYIFNEELKNINILKELNKSRFNKLTKENQKYIETTHNLLTKDNKNIYLKHWYEISKNRLLKLIYQSKLEQDKLLTYTIKTTNKQKNVFHITLASIIMVFILIVIFLMYITNNINHSLRLLSDGINDFILFIIYRDKKVVDINIDSDDEIGKMANNINKNRKLIEACFKCDEMVIKEVSQVVKNAKNDIHLVYEVKCFADNLLLENMKFDFNEMMSILKQKTDELALYDRHLEKTIKEKTSELEKTNTKLQLSHNILKDEQIRLNNFSSFLSDLNSVNIQSLAYKTLKQIFNISGSMISYFIMYEKNKLKVIASEAIDKHTLNTNKQFMVDSPIIMESLLNNKIISIEDLPLNSLEPIDIGFAKLNLNNFYSFPLVFQNKPLGVIILASSKHIDVDYLQGYILALTGSLNNAMSYNYIQEQAIVLEKANIELQKSDKMKSEFLANMSHELRTPLNSIIGFSNILKKNKKENLDSKQIDQLSKINNNGNHLLGLINNILDLSKIESGRVELDPKDFELIKFLNDIIEMLHAQAHEKKITLSFINKTQSKEINIFTDDIKLRQVCINLIGNALKFVKKDSGKVEVILSKDDQYINICIKDNGIGIPEDKIDLIFEPFRQADGSTTRKFGGTGLGLAISKNMINILEGDIEVNSKINVGSSFCIKLPLKCIIKKIRKV